MDVTSIRIKNLESKFENFDAFVKLFIERNDDGGNDGPNNTLQHQINFLIDKNKRLEALVEKQQKKTKELDKSNCVLMYHVKILKEQADNYEKRNDELIAEVNSLKTKLCDVEVKQGENATRIDGSLGSTVNASWGSALKIIAEQACKIQELKGETEKEKEIKTKVASLKSAPKMETPQDDDSSKNNVPVLVMTQKDNYMSLYKALNADGETDGYTAYPTPQGYRIVSDTLEKHFKVVKYLNSINSDFYTYNMVEEADIRVIIRGVQSHLSPGYVMEALRNIDIPVKCVRRIGNQSKKFPLVLAYFPNNDEGRKIYSLGCFLGRKVTIEEPKLKDTFLDYHLVKDGCYKCNFCDKSHYCNDKNADGI